MTKNKHNAVHFWHGFCSRVDLTDTDLEHLRRLLQGEHASLRLEKLKNADIYSIRITDERRILFTTIKKNDAPIVLVLEVLPTHDYKNAYCLKPGVLKNLVAHADGADEFTAIDTLAGLPDQLDDTADPELIPCDYYHGHFIVLNDEQTQAKTTVNMPFILSGVAGSGKTSTVLSLLIDVVESYHQQGIVPEQPILFVSEKSHLIEERRHEWQLHPLSLTPAGQHVVFKTDAQVCDDHYPDELKSWRRLSHQETEERYLKILSSQGQGVYPCQDQPLELFHEFEIAASCQDKNEYLNLGEHESHLKKADRDFFWQCAQKLTQSLEIDQCYSPRLLRIKPCVSFDTVFADEAQAGSRVFKMNLRNMARDARFVACVDSLQTTDKPISDVPFLVKKLGVNGKPAQLHHLGVSFRNPLRVIHVANTLAHMRRYSNGGKADKSEQTHLNPAEQNAVLTGQVEYLTTPQIQTLQARVNTSHLGFAVVTTEANIEKAKTVFKTGQVFTATEIGGLEFDEICVYEMSTHAYASLANTALINYSPSAKDHIHLPKSTEQHSKLLLYFNWLYTAVTRTRCSLYWVETQTKQCRHLKAHLKEAITNANQHVLDATTSTPSSVPAQTKTIDIEGFEKRIIELVKLNLTQQAKSIWEINLNRHPRDFSAFITPHLTPNENTKPKPPKEITKATILEELRHTNFVSRWIKPLPESMLNPPLIVQVFESKALLNLFYTAISKSPKLLAQVEKILYEAVIKTTVNTDQGEPLPFYFWVMNKMFRLIAFKKLNALLKDRLHKQLIKQLSETDLTKSYYAKTHKTTLPYIVLLGLQDPVMFYQCFDKNAEKLRPTLQNHWLKPLPHSICDTPKTLLSALANFEYITPLTPLHDLFKRSKVSIPLDAFFTYEGQVSYTHIDNLFHSEDAGLLTAYVFEQHEISEIFNYVNDDFFTTKVKHTDNRLISRFSLLSVYPSTHGVLTHYLKTSKQALPEIAKLFYEMLAPSLALSTLFMLTTSLPGLQFVHHIFTIRPDVIRAIPMDFWLTPNKHTNQSSTVLQALCWESNHRKLPSPIDPNRTPELYLKAVELGLIREKKAELPSLTNASQTETLIKQIMAGDPHSIKELIFHPDANALLMSKKNDKMEILSKIMGCEKLLEPFVLHLAVDPERLQSLFANCDFSLMLHIESRPEPFLHALLANDFAMQLFSLLLATFKNTMFEKENMIINGILLSEPLMMPHFSHLSALQYLSLFYPKIAGLIFRYNPNIASLTSIDFLIKPYQMNVDSLVTSIPLSLLIHAISTNDIVPFMLLACSHDKRIMKALSFDFWFEPFNNPVILHGQAYLTAIELLRKSPLAKELMPMIFVNKSSDDIDDYYDQNPDWIMQYKNHPDIIALLHAQIKNKRPDPSQHPHTLFYQESTVPTQNPKAHLRKPSA